MGRLRPPQLIFMKVTLGINILTAVEAGPYNSHMALMYNIGRYMEKVGGNLTLFTPPRMSIDRMRNEAARIALQNQSDYLFFVDDDVIVEPNTLESLLNADADIVAAETYIRGFPFNAMFFKTNADGCFEYYNDFQDKVDSSGLLIVDAVGFSCVLIKCSLLKKITTPYFVTGPNFTEDVYFCDKAISELGRENVKILVDTKVPTAHRVGSTYIHKHNKELLQKYEETIKTQFMGQKPADASVNGDRGSDYAKMVENLFIQPETSEGR